MNYFLRMLSLVFLSAVCVAVFFAGYFFDIAHLEGKLSFAQQTKMQLTKQLELAGHQQQQLEEKTMRLPEVKDQLQAWQARFIKTRDVDELLKTIAKTGKSHHLQFGYFDMEPRQVGEFYIHLPVKITVVGKLNQLVDFTSEISELPWLVIIENYKLTRLDQEQNFSMDMVLGICYIK